MNKVALININGNVAYENDSILLIENFFSLENNQEFSGIIMWINSGGGSLCVAQDVHAALMRSQIPIIAVIGELCASAAYCMALAADQIIAQPASLIGGLCASIESANYTALHEKLGVTRTMHSNGKYKQMLNPHFRQINDGEGAIIKNILDDLDSLFHALIKESRPNLSNIEEYFDGRLVSGIRARKSGLIDDFGGVFKASQIMKKMLNVETIEVTLIQSDENNTSPAESGTADIVSSLLTALHL